MVYTALRYRTLALVGGLLLLVSQVQADWKIRRSDRWEKIANRLLLMFTRRPQEGYALRRLLAHYKRRGGTGALLGPTLS